MSQLPPRSADGWVVSPISHRPVRWTLRQGLISQIGHVNQVRESIPWARTISSICFVIACYLTLNFWRTAGGDIENEVAPEAGIETEYPVWEWALQRT